MLLPGGWTSIIARPAAVASVSSTSCTTSASFRDLEKLYLELVVPGILPEQEFWAARASHLARLGSGAGASASGPRAASSSQRRGLPNSLTSEVRPAADGQTDTVHFSLTPEIIAQVRG